MLSVSPSDPNGARSPSVLIVDDDDEIRHILRLLFEFDGFDVVGEAPNGVAAVAVVAQQQPDFVILDYMMPHMNGETTAEVLRALVPGMRIVAFSGVLEEKPDWADAYLNKERIGDVAPLLVALMTAGRKSEPAL